VYFLLIQELEELLPQGGNGAHSSATGNIVGSVQRSNGQGPAL